MHYSAQEGQSTLSIQEVLTERNPAPGSENALREVVLRRLLADHIDDVLWICDSQGLSFVYLSPAFERVCGISVNELYENPLLWNEMVHPEDRAEQKKYFSDLVAYGKDFECTYRIVRADGEIRWLTDRGFLLEDDCGSFSVLGGITRDVTAEREQEAELERSNHELMQFAYVASHDLKAPMNGIVNVLNWVEEDLENNDYGNLKGNLSLIKSRAKRMVNLLEDLLHYSRLGSGVSNLDRIEVKKEIFDTFSIVRMGDSFSLELLFDDYVVYGPHTLFDLVFRNLLSNAIKHHDKPCGKISVSCMEKNDSLEFAISDDGPGIEPKYHEKIFGMLQKLDSRDKIDGSGMGLALVTRVIEMHGGYLRVESDPSVRRGTTFRFSWPKKWEKQ